MFPVRSSLAAVAAVFLLLATAAPSQSAVIDPNLTTAMNAAQAADLLSVVVTYKAQPALADIQALRNVGIRYGMTFQALPIAGVWANKAQINTIAGWANVRSVWLNSKLTYFNKEATALIGAVKQRTAAGFGFSGKGVGVAVVDSGIDGTHPDLPYPSHVKQNVKVVVGGTDLGSPFDGVVPTTYVENVSDTDGTSGHGTHCSGIIAGLGTESSGMYAGVAPGADLIGVSTGESIAVLWALSGWDYVITHRYLYNIKVCSNSWGTSGHFNADDPINVASKIMHDDGITVCFASGNDGPGSDTLNPYSVAPWVIGVAIDVPLKWA